MKVSIIIRTRNNEKGFIPLLEDLTTQTVPPSELIVVDNYSDQKQRISLKYYLVRELEKHFQDSRIVTKLVTLSDDSFSHAYSTNLGVVSAENELVCITNGHSLPLSPHWLEDGIRHFNKPSVAGISGFFIPHREGTVIGGIDRAVYRFTQEAILRQDWCSTINCIIRRSLWEAYPFDENLVKIIPETKKYGLEDYDWSREMIARGFRIIVDPNFSVFHSHGSPLHEIKRNLKGYFTYRALQQKINLLKRPRRSFSKVMTEQSSLNVETIG